MRHTIKRLSATDTAAIFAYLAAGGLIRVYPPSARAYAPGDISDAIFTGKRASASIPQSHVTAYRP